jgi:prepilin-type N-terminal cleavage/methylation domain-containing protein
MSLAGRANKPRTGVTLIEMLIVMMLLSLMVGITYPSVGAGLDSIRLSSAADATASFLNMALNHAERRQQAVEIVVFPAERRIQLASADGMLRRAMTLEDGVIIRGVQPEALNLPDGPRQFLVFPGGSAPAIGILLGNQRGARTSVSIDPISGSPRIERMP